MAVASQVAVTRSRLARNNTQKPEGANWRRTFSAMGWCLANRNEIESRRNSFGVVTCFPTHRVVKIQISLVAGELRWRENPVN